MATDIKEIAILRSVIEKIVDTACRKPSVGVYDFGRNRTGPPTFSLNRNRKEFLRNRTGTEPFIFKFPEPEPELNRIDQAVRLPDFPTIL